MRVIKIAVLAFLASGIWLAPVQAQSIIENQGLSFGILGLVPTAASGQITVDLTGTTTTSGAAISTSPGQLGNYTANDLGRQTLVTITVSQVTALSNAGSPPGATLSLSNFLFPDPAVTNNQSKLIFDLGATLTTDGTITDYAEGAYSGTILITIVVP